MHAQVDQKNESILVPIYGLMVPFHILAVKNAVNSQEGDHSYIRINFNFGPTYEPGAKFPQAIFLKELSYRTSDNRHAAKVRPLRPFCPPMSNCIVGQPCLQAVRPRASGPWASCLALIRC